MKQLAFLTTSATLVAFVSACTLPPAPPPPPTPPTRYYSATVEMEQIDNRVSSGDESGPLTADAAQIIHPGIKIAFYPPNQCATTPSEAGTGASKEGDLIRMDCGALMSRLEAQAAKAKYEVVSWQALKHKEKTPLEMARELKIDVMFEVNELSIAKRQLGSSRATGLRFGQQTDPTDRIDVAVTPAVAERCKAKLSDELAKQSPEILEAVLDAKGVEVTTGRSLWYYKWAKPESTGAGLQSGLQRYYPAPGTIDWTPPPRQHNGLQRNGALTAALGGTLTLVGGLMVGLGKANDKDAFVKGGAAALGIGLAALAGGIVMIAIGNQRQKKSVAQVQYPAPVYEPPEKIVCAYPPATPPWEAPMGPAPAPTDGGGSSTSYSFSEQTSGGQDNERARREKLVREAADEFVARLGAIATP